MLEKVNKGAQTRKKNNTSNEDSVPKNHVLESHENRQHPSQHGISSLYEYHLLCSYYHNMPQNLS